MPFMCDMLVDQGRCIGSDPIGRKCRQPAVGELECGALVCQQCRELLFTEPERLTFPVLGGREYQQWAMEAATKELYAWLGVPRPEQATPTGGGECPPEYDLGGEG